MPHSDHHHHRDLFSPCGNIIIRHFRRGLSCFLSAFLLTAFGAAFFSGCDAKDKEPSYTKRLDGRLLIDQFYSYQSVAEVKASLRERRYDEFETLVIGPPPDAPADAPPHKGVTVSVAEYYLLGVRGMLEAHFFNDRLWFVSFGVANPKEHLTQLRLLLNLESRPPVEVEVYEIDNELTWIWWKDLRLWEEQLRWMNKYSPDAVRW